MKPNAPSPFSLTQAICGVLFSLTALTACTKPDTTAKDSKATEPNAPSTAPSTNQCSKDTDCKGDRICEKGVCTAPTSTTITASSQNKTTNKTNNPALQKEVDDNYGEIEHGDLKSFKPYAGKWYLVDSSTQARNVINVATADNTKAIAGLKERCGQDFSYTFTPMSGKAIQENIAHEITGIHSYLDNADIAQAEVLMIKDDLEKNRTFSEKFNPKKEYWSHVYRCGDSAREIYYLSPTQAITMEYAGGETQIYKTVR